MIEETALRVWAKTHINIDKKDPTMAIAPRLSFALKSILPIIAVSVIEIRGSAIPAIKAGIASWLIRLKLISVFKREKYSKTKLQFDIGRNLDHSKKCTFVLE